MHQVLVVDDDEAIRELVADVLRDDGHEVDVASSAEDALARMGAGGVDLIVTDIRMGGMNGIDLLGRIRDQSKTVQVIVMTSYASTESAVAALKLGAFDYLTKPFESLDVIAATARSALEEATLARERERLVATLTNNNRRLAELNDFFRDLATKDGLTDVYNHRHLQETLAVEVQRARSFGRDLCVLFIDVDHFKRYNDRHGHQRGDEVLKKIAEILSAHARGTDVVARWGGEEFMVIAAETSLDAGQDLAERLRRAVYEHPFPGRETQPEGQITISVGVAALAPDGTKETLVGRADRAVYEAKSAGRNTVFVAA